MALKSGRVGIHPSQVDPITGMLLVDPSGTSDLSDLQDVDIQDPAAGQILVYDGNKWANEYSSVSPTTPATLQSLQDVLISSPEDGQSLVYDSDSEKWVNEFSSISPYALSQLPDVDIDDPADGDYLTYDGTSGKWVNSGSEPAPTYTDVTLTIYSAVEDLISFTDAAGITHTEQLAENQSSKSITFKINPTGSTSITFTSSVAKNPDNLSNPYSTTVSINSSTTEVYLMPNDNVLYWWGYIGEELTSSGWVYGGVSTSENAPAYNTNDITLTCTANSAKGSFIGTSNTKHLSKVCAIGYANTTSTMSKGGIGVATSKDAILNEVQLPLNTIGKIEKSMTEGDYYVSIHTYYVSTSTKFNALWYE